MWFTIPSVSGILASTTPIIASMLSSIWFIVFFALAISVAVMAALFVKRRIGGGLKSVVNPYRGNNWNEVHTRGYNAGYNRSHNVNRRYWD